MRSKYGGSMKVAIFQMSGCGTIEKNMEDIRKAVIESSTNKANLLCLPENCHSFTTNRETTRKNLEYLNGESIAYYKNLAKEYKISISIGGFPEKISETETKFHNTHVMISEEGEIEAVYRKMHLFDIDLDEKNKFMESEIISPGKDAIVTGSGVGLTICYDLRFPELYRRLALQGAQILLVPSAFLQRTGEAHWEVLLRARAIENQCFVIAAAQTGNLEGKRDSYGHSIVIDPWGKVLFDMENVVGVGYAELDIGSLEETRAKLPSLTHIRKDLFHL